MAPFPETEIMTIKRIEVALRKMDLKLLKDGAYKLHEKFHSGFKFEYIDILKEIKEEVRSNDDITADIKGILIPTIDDILEDSKINSNAQNKVSSLTSLSYNAQNQSSSNTQVMEQTKEPPKIDAFSAFSANSIHENKEHTQSPFKVEPFREFNTVEIQQMPMPSMAAQAPQTTPSVEENIQTIQIEETPTQAPIQVQMQVPTQTQMPQQTFIKEEQYQNFENISTNTLEMNNNPIEEKTQSVAIYYHLNNSQEKIKNIIKYRQLINKDDANLNEVLSLISEINTQSNVNVSELKTILEQLTFKNSYINLITNSSSAEFIKLVNSLKTEYGIFDSTNEKKLNILPFLGLTNLFTCRQCREEYLGGEASINSIIAQCPKCKSAMFPKLYALKDDYSEINTNYYNSSLIALANSNIWLVIHPQIDNKTEINMLKTALKMSNKVKNIFIADKDINIRENCRKMFLEIKEDVEVNIHMNVIEEFFKTVR